MKAQIFTIFFALNFAQLGYSIEETEVKAPQKIKISSDSTDIVPISSTSRRKNEPEAPFVSSLDLRQTKRVAIGLQGMGRAGLLGLSLDLNLNGNNTAGGFVGGGQGFNSFGFGWRRYFSGISFTPFIGVSVSRWYNASEKPKSVSNSTPSYLANTLLNADEKTSGKYALNIFAPSAGLQYFFLDGDWKNSSLLGELVMLRPIDRSSQVISAAFGYAYTF